MDIDPSTKPSFSIFPRWLRWIFITSLLLGMAAVYPVIIGLSFVPSPEWTSLPRLPASVLGLTMAVLLCWGVILRSEAVDQTMGKFRRFALIAAMPLIVFYAGSSAITAGVPMLAAIIVGTDEEFAYTVVSFEKKYDRRCRNPLQLDGSFFPFNRICGFPAEFGNSLREGDAILVSGRGTALGVFPKAALQASATKSNLFSLTEGDLYLTEEDLVPQIGPPPSPARPAP